MTKSDLLTKTSSRDIFLHYMNLMGYPGYVMGRNVRSPFRKDTHPSFGIFKARSGDYLFKDFAGDSGDCFKFVELYYKIYCGKKVSFSDVLKLITQELALPLTSNFNNLKHSRVVILPEVRKIFEEIDKQELTMMLHANYYPVYSSKYMDQLFIQKHIKPGCAACMSYLKDYGIYSQDMSGKSRENVSYLESGFVDVFINGKKVKSHNYESAASNPVFVFFPDSPLGVQNQAQPIPFRIYQPLADKLNKHYGNVKSDNIYIPKKQPGQPLPEYATLILTSGYKDALAISENTDFYAAAKGGEGWNLSEQMAFYLGQNYDNIIVLYDNDKAGHAAATRDSLTHGYSNTHIGMFEHDMQVDDEGKKIKDIADYIKLALKRKMNMNRTMFVQTINSLTSVNQLP